MSNQTTTAVPLVPTKPRHGNRRMLYLVEQYKNAHPEKSDPIDPDAVAGWAIENGIYKPEPVDPKQLLRRQIRGALRENYVEDPQGRIVHSHQPEMVEVVTQEGKRWRSRWYKMFEMPPEKMRAAGQLRRRGTFYDVQQIFFDFASYNDNNVLGAYVDQLDFNFNKDIDEAAMPTEYPEGPTLDAEDEESEV
jgi:hypothetical protein